MKRGGFVVAAVVATLFASPVGAHTAASVSIVSTSSVNRHPQVTWDLAPGWAPTMIEISTSSAVSAAGSFFQRNIVEQASLDEGQTTFLGSKPLAQGTYYVRVRAQETSLSATTWSATAALVIAQLQPPSPPPGVRLWISSSSSGRTLSRVHLGDVIEVNSKATGEFQSEWSVHGQLCVVRKNKGPRCGKPGVSFFHTTVGPTNVIRGKFTGFGTLDGTIVARTAVPVAVR
jgi:hypothetical protein